MTKLVDWDRAVAVLPVVGLVVLAVLVSPIADVHERTELEGVAVVGVETDEAGAVEAVHLRIHNHGEAPLAPVVQVWGRENVTQLRWPVEGGPIPPGETREVRVVRPERSNVVYRSGGAVTVRAPGRGQKVVRVLRTAPTVDDDGE